MKELLVTIVVLIVPFFIPTYTAWTHPNWKGVLLGAVTLWAFLFLAMAFLIVSYGTGGPAAVMLGLWVLLGWLVSALYCGLISLISKERKKT